MMQNLKLFLSFLCLKAFSIKGNITFMGAFILILASYFTLHLVLGELTKLKKLKEQSELYLCTKKLLIEEKRYVEKIMKLNKVLVASNLAMMASIMFPNIISANLSLPAIKDKLKKLQELIHQRRNFTLLSLSKEGCDFPLNISSQPFNRKNGLFERNLLGQSLLVKNRWFYYVTKNKKKLLIEMNYQEKLTEKIISL